MKDKDFFLRVVAPIAARRFRWDNSARRLTLEPDERMQQWPGGPRTFAIEVVGQRKPRRIEFSGRRIEVTL